MGSLGAGLVDWDLAVATATRVAPPGPAVTSDDAAEAVASLATLAGESDGHVRELTGLDGPAPRPGGTQVVDRPGWVRNNTEGLGVLLEPLTARLAEERSGRGRRGGAVVGAVGSRVTGLQAGVLLGYLSTRVLGQYEVFLPPAAGPGRLTLVAPNIVETERALGVDPRDFRLWVCLHESCHRLQFTAVPWLRGHLQSEIGLLLEQSGLDDPAALAARLRAAVSGVGEAVRARRSGAPAPSLLELVQTPEQRVVLDRLTAVMTLLEGHAEHVMDEVGPSVVPSVAHIRRQFDQRRRTGGGPLDRVLRRLLGLDAKARQYVEGRRFVDATVRVGGLAGFNQVWSGPESLPTREEIREPQRWISRVLGERLAIG